MLTGWVDISCTWTDLHRSFALSKVFQRKTDKDVISIIACIYRQHLRLSKPRRGSWIIVFYQSYCTLLEELNYSRTFRRLEVTVCRYHTFRSWQCTYSVVRNNLNDLRQNNFNYYIVESEILKNTQWDISSISSLVKISVTWLFPICFWAWNFTTFCLGLYNKQNITRWLEDMTFIFSC